MRILHIAPYDIAGVPMTMVRAERSMGHDSRLVTLFRDPQGRREDIGLDLPLFDSGAIRLAKRFFTPASRREVGNVARIPDRIPVLWEPGGVESLLVRWREGMWKSRIENAIEAHRMDAFDVVQLDGGMEFYRDGRTVRRWKAGGKILICCYTGSDLRTRGVIPAVDEVADTNVTVEFDHLRFHPEIHHVGFPLDASPLGEKENSAGGEVRIGHAPTHRGAKGSDVILPILRRLEETHPVRLVLIEGLPYAEAMARKSTCDLFIDQIGDLGYGMNGIEALAMGIPTCSCLAPGFAEAYPDHPFVEIDEENLREAVLRLVENPALRAELGAAGKAWVRRVHDPVSVVEKIHRIAGLRDD